MDEQYQPRPASFFSLAARDATPARVTIWAYCPTCWERTEHVFIRDVGIYEVYRCACGNEYQAAVR
jgi:hypothetical protein